MGPCCRYLPCNIRQQRLCTIVEQANFTKNIISSIYNLIFFDVIVESLQTMLETIMLRGHLYIPKQEHTRHNNKNNTPRCFLLCFPDSGGQSAISKSTYSIFNSPHRMWGNPIHVFMVDDAPHFFGGSEDLEVKICDKLMYSIFLFNETRPNQTR